MKTNINFVEPINNGMAASNLMPYKGLMPYEETDAIYFFGREKWRDVIIDNLRASRLSVLYGSSGVGKSSVLRAGVVHTLQQQARQNRELYGKPELAVVYFNQWQGEPLEQLRKQLEKNIETFFTEPQNIPISTSIPFDRALQEWIQKLTKERGIDKLFVILDQFEDYFLYQGHQLEEGTFGAEFPKVVNQPGLPVNFLISLREDAVSKLDKFEQRLPHLWGNLIRLEPLDELSASDAIRKPVKEYNRQFRTNQPSISIEPALIQAVIEQVKIGRMSIGEKGRGGIDSSVETAQEVPIETPFLQMVMIRLWQEEVNLGSHRLRKTTLDKLGGANQIVKEHLDGRLDKLSTQEQIAAAHIFNYLVTPSGAKISQTVDDLMRYVNEEEDGSIHLARREVQSLLETLSYGDARILRPVPPSTADPRERYEIFHDVLADAILNWRSRYLEQQRLDKKESELAEIEKKEREKLFIETEKKHAKTLKKLALLSLLFASIMFAVGISILSGKQEKLAVTKLNLDAKQFLVDLENADQLDTLKKTMLLGNSAQEKNLLGQVTAQNLALQQILANIHLKNQWNLPDSQFVSAWSNSPDGRWIALGTFYGEVFLWDSEEQNFREPFSVVENNEKRQIAHIGISQNGERIVTALDGNQIRIWDQRGEKVALNLPEITTIRMLSLSPNGQYLAVVPESGDEVILWNFATANQLTFDRQVSGENVFGRISQLKFSPDSRRIGVAARATQKNDYDITIWDLQGNLLKTFQGAHSRWISDLSFSPNGQWMASTSSDKTAGAKLWALESEDDKPLWRFKEHESAVLSVTFSPDNQKIVTGGSDGTAIVWQIAALESNYVEASAILRLTGHNSYVRGVSFNRDTTDLVSVTELGTVYLWNLTQKNQNIVSDDLKNLANEVEQYPLSQVIFNPTNPQQFATISSNRNPRDGGNFIQIWNLNGENLLKYPIKDTANFYRPQIFYRQDGQQFATFSADGTVNIWDLTGELVDELFKAKRNVEWPVGIDFLGDQIRLIIATNRGLQVNEYQGTQLSPQPPRPYPLQDGDDLDIRVAAFSPDGKQLAAGSREGKVYLLELQTGESESLIPKDRNMQAAHSARISSVHFHAQNQRLLTASLDGTARIWNLKGEEKHTLNHLSPIMGARFNQDGTKVVTVSWNSFIRVWDVETGQQVAEYRGSSGIWDASFSPSQLDRETLVTVGFNARETQLWPIHTYGELFDAGCDWLQDYLSTTDKNDRREDFNLCNE